MYKVSKEMGYSWEHTITMPMSIVFQCFEYIVSEQNIATLTETITHKDLKPNDAKKLQREIEDLQSVFFEGKQAIRKKQNQSDAIEAFIIANKM